MALEGRVGIASTQNGQSSVPLVYRVAACQHGVRGDRRNKLIGNHGFIGGLLHAMDTIHRIHPTSRHPSNLISNQATGTITRSLSVFYDGRPTRLTRSWKRESERSGSRQGSIFR
jgi:hypothetical protein